MPSEYAPAPPKIRITRKQLREIQRNYEKASLKSKDFRDIEEIEKANLEDEIQKKLDEI